jgi:hypothetical protein
MCDLQARFVVRDSLLTLAMRVTAIRDDQNGGPFRFEWSNV